VSRLSRQPNGNTPDGGQQKERTHVTNTRSRLTITEVCEDLGIARSTFYEWRAKGTAPRCIKLPNGEIRVRRAEYDRWLNSLEDAA